MKINYFAAFCTLTFCAFYLGFCFFCSSLFYPVKFSNHINQSCLKYDVDICLVYSVINAESSFNQNALSHAGAQGLMQLLPSTANYIAQKINYVDSINLFNPACNIELGVAYISYLENVFDTTELVLCAYNAGEGVVREWLKEDKEKNISSFPYKETISYVKKVELNYEIYSKKIG